tara:strand:- start:621 stop:785 length:165 start_codon:yes stop_codon:yes gene_type:complete
MLSIYYNPEKQKSAKIKKRNWLAVHAHNRKAGAMPDKKKQQNKKACRGQVKGGE